MTLNCETEIRHHNKIIVVRLSGKLYSQEFSKIDSENREKAIELGYKLIYDFSRTINHISIVEAYHWYFDFHSHKCIDSHLIPVVFLSNQNDVTFFKFFETTSLNKGFNIKMFTDEDAAIKWLEEI